MTIIDLPWPPSTNRIWRHGRGRTYLDPRYAAWKREADATYLANKRKWRPIKGQFNARITLDETRPRRGDLDNRIKPILDFLQRVGLIENDSLLKALSVTWGDADGVRVELSAA